VDGERLCQPGPGQFVTVRIVPAEGAPITRCWSLSDYAPAMDRYRLTVRRQEGPGSNWLHRAEVGALVEFRAPAGQFTLDMGGFRPVILIAAGIGITPLLAMLQAQLSRPIGAPVHLIYGAKSAADMAFRDEIDALAANRDDLFVHQVFSRETVPGAQCGRITADLVIEALADLHFMLHDHRIDIPWFESDMYLCGPGAFCENLHDELVERGANSDRTFFERFDGAAASADAVERAEINFALSGKTVQWTANDDLTLLELAERAGVAINNDCRAGACLTCKSRILEGKATVDLGEGFTLPCVSRPAAERVVVEA
jgi:ferredoxin-NADP reductase